MKKLTFGFVILHYQAFDMTVESVETIKANFDISDKYIVIVDNQSPNGSGELLLKKYINDSNIKVILASGNLGFANGNNLGYDYLKANFDVDFIIVMNNDVLIKQENFFQSIIEIYNKEKFAVLGPDVYCPKAEIHQNPFRLTSIGKNEFKKMFFVERIKKILGYSLFMKLVYPILNRNRKRNIQDNDNYKNELLNPVLHGSCFIFSKDFINKRKYCFNPQTYMFFEENILHFECMKAGLKLFYSPKIQILHMEDVSTDMVFKKNVQKENWKIKHSVNSMKVYRKLLVE